MSHIAPNQNIWILACEGAVVANSFKELVSRCGRRATSFCTKNSNYNRGNNPAEGVIAVPKKCCPTVTYRIGGLGPCNRPGIVEEICPALTCSAFHRIGHDACRPSCAQGPSTQSRTRGGPFNARYHTHRQATIMLNSGGYLDAYTRFTESSSLVWHHGASHCNDGRR